MANVIAPNTSKIYLLTDGSVRDSYGENNFHPLSTVNIIEVYVEDGDSTNILTVNYNPAIRKSWATHWFPTFYRGLVTHTITGEQSARTFAQFITYMPNILSAMNQNNTTSMGATVTFQQQSGSNLIGAYALVADLPTYYEDWEDLQDMEEANVVAYVYESGLNGFYQVVYTAGTPGTYAWTLAAASVQTQVTTKQYDVWNITIQPGYGNPAPITELADEQYRLIWQELNTINANAVALEAEVELKEDAAIRFDDTYLGVTIKTDIFPASGAEETVMGKIEVARDINPATISDIPTVIYFHGVVVNTAGTLSIKTGSAKAVVFGKAINGTGVIGFDEDGLWVWVPISDNANKKNGLKAYISSVGSTAGQTTNGVNRITTITEVNTAPTGTSVIADMGVTWGQHITLASGETISLSSKIYSALKIDALLAAILNGTTTFSYLDVQGNLHVTGTSTLHGAVTADGVITAKAGIDMNTTQKIIKLADGTADTDAATVGQFKNGTTIVDKANKDGSGNNIVDTYATKAAYTAELGAKADKSGGNNWLGIQSHYLTNGMYFKINDTNSDIEFIDTDTVVIWKLNSTGLYLNPAKLASVGSNYCPSKTLVDSYISTHNGTVAYIGSHPYILALIEALQHEIDRLNSIGKSWGEVAYETADLVAMEDDAHRAAAIEADILGRYDFYVKALNDYVYDRGIVVDGIPTNYHSWKWNASIWADEGIESAVGHASNTLFGLVKGDGTYTSITNGIITVLLSDTTHSVVDATTGLLHYTYEEIKAVEDRLAIAEIAVADHETRIGQNEVDVVALQGDIAEIDDANLNESKSRFAPAEFGIVTDLTKATPITTAAHLARLHSIHIDGNTVGGVSFNANKLAVNGNYLVENDIAAIGYLCKLPDETKDAFDWKVDRVTGLRTSKAYRPTARIALPTTAGYWQLGKVGTACTRFFIKLEDVYTAKVLNARATHVFRANLPTANSWIGTPTNSAINGEFAANIIGWGSGIYGTTTWLEGGYAIGTGSGENIFSYTRSTNDPFTVGAYEHQWYIKARARVTNNLCTQIRLLTDGDHIFDTQSSPEINVWYDLAGLGTINDKNIGVWHHYANTADCTDAVIELDYVRAYDLTVIFGSGNEPTAEGFEVMLPHFDAGIYCTLLPAGLETWATSVVPTAIITSKYALVEFDDLETGIEQVSIDATSSWLWASTEYEDIADFYTYLGTSGNAISVVIPYDTYGATVENAYAGNAGTLDDFIASTADTALCTFYYDVDNTDHYFSLKLANATADTLAELYTYLAANPIVVTVPILNPYYETVVMPYCRQFNKYMTVDITSKSAVSPNAWQIEYVKMAIETAPSDVEYGVREVVNASSPTLERVTRNGATMLVGANTGLSAAAGVDTQVVTNSFDAIPIFARVPYTDIYGNVFTTVKKYYIKEEWTTEIGVNYHYWWMCATQLAGYRLPLSFVNEDGTENDVYYIGRYEASLNGSDLKSVTGAVDKVSYSRANFRTAARHNDNLGATSKYQITDVAEYVDLVQTPMMIEFATKNLQTVLRGFTEGSYTATHLSLLAETGVNRVILTNAQAATYRVGQCIDIGTSQGGRQVAQDRVIVSITADTPAPGQSQIVFDGAVVTTTLAQMVYNVSYKTGQCDAVVATSGSKTANDGKNACIWRGMENPYGNNYKNVDGVKFSNNQTWICLFPSLYNDTASVAGDYVAPYVKLSYLNINANGYCVALGYDPLYPFAKFPTSITGGSSVLFFSDYYYQSTGDRTCFVGGYWVNSSAARPFDRNSDGGLGGTSLNFGACLSKRP